MSRLTFREKCPSVCWQKQLRDKYNGEGAPPVPHLDVKRAVVRPVTRKLAEQIILKYEWLGTMAATRWHYGIFYGNYCAGVCCVGDTSVLAGVHFADKFGIPPRCVLILARGACAHWAPKGSNTKLVAWTVRLVTKDTGAKIIAAFSDTDAGEIGTIYQASNWVCLGKGQRHPHLEVVAPSGRICNRKIIGDVSRNNGISHKEARLLLGRKGFVFQPNNEKYRYVYVLDKTDKALVDRIERMRQPYPKRASAEGETGALSKSDTGGANPTDALLT